MAAHFLQTTALPSRAAITTNPARRLLYMLAAGLLLLSLTGTASAQAVDGIWFPQGLPGVNHLVTATQTELMNGVITGCATDIPKFRCAFDGNATSYMTYTSAGTSTACDTTNSNVKRAYFDWDAPVTFDTIALDFGKTSSAGGVCLAVYWYNGPTPVLLEKFPTAGVHLKVYEQPVTTDRVELRFSNPSANGPAVMVYRDIQIYQREATTYPVERALLDLMPHAGDAFTIGTAPAMGSAWGADTFNVGIGTFQVYAMVPVHDLTGAIVPYGLTCVPSHHCTVLENEHSLTLPAPGSPRSCAAQRIKFTSTLDGVAVILGPARNIAEHERPCAMEYGGRMPSHTTGGPQIYADLTNWGGTTGQPIGIAYPANNAPFAPATRTQLAVTENGLNQKTSFYPTGTHATSGANGASYVIDRSVQPYAWYGNGVYHAISQPKNTTHPSDNWAILVDGRPASLITAWTDTTHSYALFYIDDQARRAQQTQNIAGSILSGNKRDANPEAYAITILSGLDPNANVGGVGTNTNGKHVDLACHAGFCYGVTDMALRLPKENANRVDFNIKNSAGTPLEGVNTRADTTAQSQITDATGFARHLDVFTEETYTLSKTGYADQRIRFKFTAQGGVTTGTDPDGVPYIRSYNATFSVTLLTNEQAGLGDNGTISIDPSIPDLTIHFDGNTSREVPDTIQINITRNIKRTIYVDCVKLDPLSGAIRSACTADIWEPYHDNLYTFHYPTSVRTTTDITDTGSYHLFLVNETGHYLTGTNYCISITWQPTCNGTINNEIKTQLGADTLNEAQAVKTRLREANIQATEQSVRERFLNAMEYGFKPLISCDEPKLSICTMPKIAIWYLATILIGGIGVMGNRFARNRGT